MTTDEPTEATGAGASDDRLGLPDAPDAPAAPGSRRRLRWAAGALGLLAVAGIGTYAYRQIEPVVSARKYRTVTYQVPEAPQLTATGGETVYRIDPTQSSLTYEIQEKFAGRETSTATGVTNGIAGDLAVDPEDPGASRIGRIVVNVEQFHSDNNLRDARLRQDFLESNAYPLASFELTEVSGLEGPLAEGTTYPFTLQGHVTVKDVKVAATFEATASVADGKLTATATTVAKLSRFEAGPISIAGLVTTSDDVTLTLELTALDPTQYAIPTKITGPDAKEPDASDAPSFGRSVQPILEANCVACHATGEMGAAHITLDNAGQAAAISDGIETVTQTRYMPPWPASDTGVPLAHETTLSDADLATLSAWSRGGGVLDVAEDTKLVAPEAIQALQPRDDLVLTRPPYTGSVDNANDYRCFVLEPKLTEAKFLTGYTFEPDVIEQLHHAQVFHISAEQRESATAKEGADGKPGWGCYAGPFLAGDRPNGVPGREKDNDVGFAGQANLVAGWVPGQSPVIFPENSGIYLKPGDALVLQLHYHYGYGDVLPDESGLSIQLDDADSGVKGLRVVNPLAPVEIPCAPEDADAPLCDRDAALADNVELYGPSGASNEAGLLGLCGKTPEELTESFDGQVATSTCDLTIPEDGTIIGAMGHMHTLGKTFRFTLDPDTAEETVMLDIPIWSFDWQMNYQLETPIEVKAGQKLRLDCSWDRGADPDRPPKYIVFAEGTEDEMCFGTYSLIPKDQ